MIAVIADDITGAVEIGGIALDYGLSVKVVTVVPTQTDVEVLVVASDSRSERSAETAAAIMRRLTIEVQKLNPAYIFKKIDSVLRGHIIAETLAQMQVLQFQKAVLVAANPSTGRCIVDGKLYINQIPIDQTSFAFDPDFPAKSADVLEILGIDNKENKKIMVGNVSTLTDLKNWAIKYDSKTFLVGGAAFFEAVLDTIFVKQKPKTMAEAPMSRLYVCGSMHRSSADWVEAMNKIGEQVCYVSANDYFENNIEKWLVNASERFNFAQQLIVAIDRQSSKIDLSIIVASLLQKITINELLIEGGATAWALLQRLSINQLEPVRQLAKGVVRCKVHSNLFVTLKPGSYPWPTPTSIFSTMPS